MNSKIAKIIDIYIKTVTVTDISRNEMPAIVKKAHYVR